MRVSKIGLLQIWFLRIKTTSFWMKKRAEKSRKQRNNKKWVRTKVKKSKMPLSSLIQAQVHPLNITTTTRKKSTKKQTNKKWKQTSKPSNKQKQQQTN